MTGDQPEQCGARLPQDGSGTPPEASAWMCRRVGREEHAHEAAVGGLATGRSGPLSQDSCSPLLPTGHPSRGHQDTCSSKATFVDGAGLCTPPFRHGKHPVLSSQASTPATLAMGHPITLGAMAHDHVMVDGTRTAPHGANTARSQAGSRGAGPRLTGSSEDQPCTDTGVGEGRDAMSSPKQHTEQI